MSQISASSSMHARRSSPRFPRPDSTPYEGQLNLNFKNASHRVIYNELLREEQVEPAITVDEEALVELGIYEQFTNLFRQAGLISLATYSGKTYEHLVREFISSFEVKRVDGRVVEWKFRMGNRNFSYDRERLSEVFVFPESGSVPQFSESERVQFWGRITGMDHYKGDMSPKCIRDGLWKCVHRIIALAINTRRDTGSMVTKKDLDIMLAMSRQDRIDCTQLLADRFLEWKDTKSKNKALGGAPFIAMIAQEEHFDLSGCEGIYKPLDIDQMVHTQMLLPSKTQWVHEPSEGKRGNSSAGKRRKTRKEREESSEQAPSGSASWDDMNRRLSRLELTQDAMYVDLRRHVERSNEHHAWVEEKMMQLMNQRQAPGSPSDTL